MSDQEDDENEEQAWGWGSGEEDENNPEDDALITIENNQYEGDGLKERNPNQALEKFNLVLELEKAVDDFDKKQSFQALTSIILINFNLNNKNKLLEPYKKLLSLIQTVAGNDAQNAINSILDHVSKINDISLEYEMYEITLDFLKKGGNQSLWFKTSQRLAKLQLDKNELVKLNNTITIMKESCQVNSVLELSKTSCMLETLKLEIQLCILTGEAKRMKIANFETTKLLEAVTGLIINGPIKESGGYNTTNPFGIVNHNQSTSTNSFENIKSNNIDIDDMSNIYKLQNKTKNFNYIDIINIQDIEGYWNFEQNVINKISKDYFNTSTIFDIPELLDNLSITANKTILWHTLLIVALFSYKFDQYKHEWELVINKSNKYIHKLINDVDYKDLQNIAESYIK